jgi:hypothetical protein
VVVDQPCERLIGQIVEPSCGNRGLERLGSVLHERQKGIPIDDDHVRVAVAFGSTIHDSEEDEQTEAGRQEVN